MQPSAAERKPERSIRSDWACRYLAHTPSQAARHALPAEAARDAGSLILIESLLSGAECSALVKAAEREGFGTTDYPKSYRGNLRLIAADPGLADALWARLRPLVPAAVTRPRRHHGQPPPAEDQPSGLGHEGAVWEAVGLNDHFRLAKYFPGDRFAPHCDAPFIRVHGLEESLFTVNVYLNSIPDDVGGATCFLDLEPAALPVEPFATALPVGAPPPPAAPLLRPGDKFRDPGAALGMVSRGPGEAAGAVAGAAGSASLPAAAPGVTAAPGPGVTFRLVPSAGLACVFRQPPDARLLHAGEPVGAGCVKYLLRTDAMYRCRELGGEAW